MSNEKKMLLLQPIGIIGLLLVSLGIYIKFVDNERLIANKFFNELSEQPEKLMIVGAVLVVFYLYLLLPILLTKMKK